MLSLSFTAVAFSTNVRGSMKGAAVANDPKVMLNERKDTKDIGVADADEKADEKELAANLREQMELNAKIEELADKAQSDQEIESQAKQVANETESPALGKTLATMWKEMRTFETPQYTE